MTTSFKAAAEEREAALETATPDARAWFESAIFYKLPVRSFFDAAGTGGGDLRGLTQKLGYLQDLGITCLWLLPIFPSPQRDDGFDVSDYRDVHATYGTMDHFRELLRECQARGLRVVLEMVINHTSDEHPWFQAARTAEPGSPLRDFYVWSASADRFREAKVLPDSGRPSNWSWDAEANAFYWHRFSRHQPDLNYGSDLVRAEMLKVLRFWADLGVDGLCLNGAAYLAEREGTSCEHLPETHAIIQEFRRELTAEYPDLMLQAGVNAWPNDSVSYLGAHECQMVPCLALAPRTFLALRQEAARPLANLLRQLPELPIGTQWVTLLRNHDELTLSLASDEEQDYLFREYSADVSTRHHNGILRRLAPLAGNDRRQIELLFGLLFALPGSPVIYYGDEIGMGDNEFLGGRNSVRTPMQWNADRNGGFSPADFARLGSPPVMDPIYGYQAVNVDRQQRDPASLLHWMRKLIALRKRHPVFAYGALEVLEVENRKVSAFVRRLPASAAAEAEIVLVVANLAGTAQAVELDLQEFAGLIPVEMFGRSHFPTVQASSYALTLAPHGCFWFRLQRTTTPSVSQLAAVETGAVAKLPSIAWDGTAEDLCGGNALRALERDVLPEFLRSQRWFGGKARTVDSIRLRDSAAIAAEDLRAFHFLFEVNFAHGKRDLYYLPLCLKESAAAVHAFETNRSSLVAQLDGAQGQGVLVDAAADPAFCSHLLGAVSRGESTAARHGSIHTEPTAALSALRSAGEWPAARFGPATSSNSLIFFGRRLLLKLFRRLEVGVNPDYEVGRFLTESPHFRRSPEVGGKLEYLPAATSEPFTLGILQALVTNQGDGWAHAIEELHRYFTRASARMFAPDVLLPDSRPLLELAAATPPPAALETIGSYLHSAAVLGRRTAEMHLALAGDSSNADFAPEPLAANDLAELGQELELQHQRAAAALAARRTALPSEIAPDAQRFLERGSAAVAKWGSSCVHVPAALKTRIHGDYHLGQVLSVDHDYMILDFEGEPTRTVTERRAKFSPLRDVAGMLRSYHYAAYAGLFAFTQDRPADLARLAPWADLWNQWVSAAFLKQYLTTAAGAPFLPRDAQETARLLETFMISKALYELAYELNNRPTWVRIPLGGVLRLLRLEPADDLRQQETAP